MCWRVRFRVRGIFWRLDVRVIFYSQPMESLRNWYDIIVCSVLVTMCAVWLGFGLGLGLGVII